VRREVRRRDGAMCQWPLDSGGVCGSTVRLEIDHVVPRGRGGASTVENCRVLCRFHNQQAARHAYGDVWMDRFTIRTPEAREPSAGWARNPSGLVGPGRTGIAGLRSARHGILAESPSS
jgi:5-methylcytosine-specific restriction endonuclease McrA